MPGPSEFAPGASWADEELPGKLDSSGWKQLFLNGRSLMKRNFRDFMKLIAEKIRWNCAGKQCAYAFILASSTLFMTGTHCCLAADLSRPPVSQRSVSIATELGAASGHFVLYGGGQAAPIYVDREDFSTVALVADAFAGDVEQVTGKRPRILGHTDALHTKNLIIFGTIDHSPLLDKLRASGQLDTSSIEGKWESAITTVVKHPFSGVNSALVIAGSDRRGTAYAVFDLSRRIGISPWNWWADVPAKHHSFIAVGPGTFIQGPPSVRYRGIFLNDE